jgi:integrase
LPHSHTRPNPYFFTDEDIEGLLQGVLRLPAKDGLANHTYCCLFGLLSVTGLRIGEALGLNVEDVDLDEGILTILSAKCGKSRLAWVIPTTVARSSAPVCPVEDIALVSRRRGCGTTNNGAFSISWPRRSQRYLLVFVGLPTIAGCGQGTA